jgi:hypothetical protein
MLPLPLGVNTTMKRTILQKLPSAAASIFRVSMHLRNVGNTDNFHTVQRLKRKINVNHRESLKSMSKIMTKLLK